MKRYRWVVLGLMVLLTFINYVDRASLSIVAPYVMKEFDLSPAEMGVLFSGFFASYALFCFIGGYISDIYGPKKTITIALVLWSVFAAARLWPGVLLPCLFSGSSLAPVKGR